MVLKANKRLTLDCTRPETVPKIKLKIVVNIINRLTGLLDK